MRWTLLIGLVGCAAHRVDSQRDKGFQDAQTTAQALSRALEPQRRAILVGVDSYTDPAFDDLHHAGADADALADVLRDPGGGGFDDVVRLPTPVTRDAVARALRTARAQLRREDTLLVYFSGHGTRVPDGDRWRRFLLTTDSRAANLEATALDLAEIQSFFAAVPAARKALVVDACFSGDGKSVVRPEHRDIEVAHDTLVSPGTTLSPGEAYLFATSAGRPSRESDKLGHGVYTYYLLEAMSWGFTEADLDEDGVVTAWEAHDFARGRTVEFTDGVQVPEAALHVVGEGDLVLSGSRDDRKRRDRSLVYLYADAGHALHGAELVVDGRLRGALPGTVSVSPGRHRIELRDAGGHALVDGYVTLSSGRSYSVEDVRRVANGPGNMLTLRPVFLASPPMKATLGSGTLGLELAGLRRVNRGPAKGVYGGWAAGAGLRPAQRGTDDARTAVWLTGEGGMQGDLRRLRARGGFGFSAWFLPPSWPQGRPDVIEDIRDHPGEAGWLVTAMGPSGSAGWVVNEAWTVALAGRAHAAVLDVDGDGRPSLVPWFTLSLGPEASW